MIYNKYKKATAIITAVLIVAVVSIAAITMQGYLSGEMNRTKLLLDNDKLLNKAYGIESWGLTKLKQIIKENNSYLDENIKLELNNYDAKLLGKIKSQNGLFNLNYLYNMDLCSKGVYDKNQDIRAIIFTRLLNLQQVNELISDDEIALIISNIQNWMCPNTNDVVSYDLNGNSKWSYQKAGQFFVDKSELRLIPGITNEIYQKISKYITAFPIALKGNSVKINFDVNYLNPDVFAAIANIDKQTAKSFLEQLKNKINTEKLKEIREYLTQQNADKIQTSQANADLFTSDSASDSYYIILSRASSGEYIVQIQTLVHVADNQLNIIWRKQGLYNE